MKKSSKRKKLDEVERLENEIKELKSQNRDLLKRLKSNKKYEKETCDSTNEEYSEKKTKCPECYKDYLIEVRVIGRVFKRCETCGYREKVKKI